MTPSVLAIDIGNTTTSVALVDSAALTCVCRRSIPTVRITADLTSILRETLSDAGHTLKPTVIISSVVTSAQHDIPPLLRTCDIGRIHWMGWHPGLGLPVSYPDPCLLGTDRLANGLYCARMYPGRTAVIIDAGTAIKVDLVRKGALFAGGTIFPGIAAQSNALNAETSRLPLITPDSIPPIPPGRSTDECIRCGIMYGIAGGIEKMVKTYQQAEADDPVVLATGGAWPLLAPLVDLAVKPIPDMTLSGIGTFTPAPLP